jgi:hypothetical protein
MTGIEGLSHAGNDGGVVSHIVGAPLRVIGRSLEEGRRVAGDRRSNGILRTALEAGLVVPKAIGREVLYTPIGVGARILGNTRDAMMNILRPTARIALHGAAELIRIPTGVDIRDAGLGRLNRIASSIDGGTTLNEAITGTSRAALERASRPGSGPGAGATGSNPEPRPA